MGLRCKGKSLAAVAASLLLATVLCGCVNQRIDTSNADVFYDRFVNGTLRLSDGFGRVGNNIWFADRMYEAAAKQDWAELSKIVIQSDAGDDIGYYYLGRAAEGLGHPDAAREYYRLSIDASLSQKFPTQCTLVRGASYLGPQCHGLILPRDARSRLAALGYGS